MENPSRVNKEKSSTSVVQGEPSKKKETKNLKQGKGESKETSHNYYRWLLTALNAAVVEHRWEDAFKLLPCLILQRCYYVSSDFLWRITNIITKNLNEVPKGMRKSLRRDFCLLPVKTIVVVLDTLTEELENASEEEVNEIVQMLEDLQCNRMSEKWTTANNDVRLTALIEAYRGLVLYSRWKNYGYCNQDSSVGQEKISINSEDTADHEEDSSDEENEEESKDSNQKLASEAHAAMRRALCNLSEPVEWIIGPYLDLENELHGPESALSVLKDYVNKNPQHLPAQQLVYNFLRNFVPKSIETQMSALKEISRLCPEHPLVLEYVDRLLVEACDQSVWGQTETADDSDDTERRHPVQFDWDFLPLPEEETQNCDLKSDVQVESLLRSLNLLTDLLEYKEWQWKLQPWQTLTHILRKFYNSWLRCWKCQYCRKSRKSVRQVSKRITPLWQYYVWVAFPTSVAPEKAQVIFHHIYAAHVFCYKKSYVRKAVSTLKKANYTVLSKELKESLYPQNTYLDKFLTYSLKKSKEKQEEPHHIPSDNEVQIVETESREEAQESVKSVKARSSKKARKGRFSTFGELVDFTSEIFPDDMLFSDGDDELIPAAPKKSSRSKKKSELETGNRVAFEEKEKIEQTGLTQLPAVSGVKHIKSTVANKVTTSRTKKTKATVHNDKPSPKEEEKEISFLGSDISFDENFILTSTQVRPGNKQALKDVCNMSLGESPAFPLAPKERDSLRNKERNRLKLSKAKGKHRNEEGKQKEFVISSEDSNDDVNEEGIDMSNQPNNSEWNSSLSEEYVTVNETSKEAKNITRDSNVKNSTVLCRKSISTSLNSTYTVESPMRNMASKNEGKEQINHPYGSSKNTCIDICSTRIVDEVNTPKTAECSSPEPEDYLTCGQRSREDRSSGYKGGSSEEQNESPSLANAGNDSVYFCYTTLPTHNPIAYVPDSQDASVNNCLAEDTLTQTNSNPHSSYEGKYIVQETQSQEMFSQSIAGSVSEVAGSTDPNGFAGKNWVKVECEDIGTQQSGVSEPFSLTQGQHFSQDGQELISSADITDTTDITTFYKTERISPVSEKEYKVFEVHYEDVEQEAHSPNTSQVCYSLKQESDVAVGPDTRVEFSDNGHDKFASPKCAVQKIIQSNCLDTPPTPVTANEENSDSEEMIGPSQELIVTSPPNFKSFINKSNRSRSSGSDGSFVSNTSSEYEQEHTLISIYSSLTALQGSSNTAAASEKLGKENQEKDILQVVSLEASKGSVQEEMEYVSLPCNEGKESSHAEGTNVLIQKDNSGGNVTLQNNCSISNTNMSDNNKKCKVLDVICERRKKSEYLSDESFVTAESVGDSVSLRSVDVNDNTELLGWQRDSIDSSRTSKLMIDTSNPDSLPENSFATATSTVDRVCQSADRIKSIINKSKQKVQKSRRKEKSMEGNDISLTNVGHETRRVDSDGNSLANGVLNTDVDSFETALDEIQKSSNCKQEITNVLELLEDMNGESDTNDIEVFKSKKMTKKKEIEITKLPVEQIENDIPKADQADSNAYEASKKSKKRKKKKEKCLDMNSDKTKETNLFSHNSKSKKSNKNLIIGKEVCDEYWLDLITDLPFPELENENEDLIVLDKISKSKSQSEKVKNATSKAAKQKCPKTDLDCRESTNLDTLVTEECSKERILDTGKISKKKKKERKKKDEGDDQINRKSLETKEENEESRCGGDFEGHGKKGSKKKKHKACSGEQKQEDSEIDFASFALDGDCDIKLDKKNKSKNKREQRVDDGMSLQMKLEKKKRKREQDRFEISDLCVFPDIEMEPCSISDAANGTYSAKSEDDILSQKKKRKKEDTSSITIPNVSQVNGHHDCSDLVKRKKDKKKKSKETEDELLIGFPIESVLDLINEDEECATGEIEKKSKKSKRQREDSKTENKEKSNQVTKKIECAVIEETKNEKLKKRRKRDDTFSNKEDGRKESPSKNKAQERIKRIKDKKGNLTPPWNKPLRSHAKFHKLYNPDNDDLL